MEYVLGNDSRAWRAEDYDTLCKKVHKCLNPTPYMLVKEWFYEIQSRDDRIQSLEKRIQALEMKN